jgi:FkbM family methyltransferase
MNAASFREDLFGHQSAGRATRREALLRSVDRLEADPLAGMPSALREADPRQLRVVLFGTTVYADIVMLAARPRRIQVIAAVDDFRPDADYSGLPVIKSGACRALVPGSGPLVAIITGRSDRSIRFFQRLADECGIPMLSFEQAVRLFGMEPHIDHRVADWGPEIVSRRDEFLALGDRMTDDYSRETLYGVLLFHLTGDMEWIHDVNRPYSTLYFRSGLFVPGAGERFVDCGASIGESTGGLMALTRGKVGRVWMIEPDKFNHERLEAQMAGEWSGARDRMSLHKVAIGAEPGVIPFNHVGGHSGSISVGAPAYGDVDTVDIARIDDIVDAPPTFVKMDIEGAEGDALKGAARCIRTARPTLAISAYHRKSDLLDLTGYIDSLGCDYRIGLRHHTEDRYDTCLYFMPA